MGLPIFHAPEDQRPRICSFVDAKVNHIIIIINLGRGTSILLEQSSFSKNSLVHLAKISCVVMLDCENNRKSVVIVVFLVPLLQYRDDLSPKCFDLFQHLQTTSWRSRKSIACFAGFPAPCGSCFRGISATWN